MPGGDRTGPEGAGPMTGRARGYCSGSDAAGYINWIPARSGIGGGGRGRRGGFANRYAISPVRSGFTGSYYPQTERPITEKEEVKNLEYQMENLENKYNLLKEEIEKIANKISELKEKK